MGCICLPSPPIVLPGGPQKCGFGPPPPLRLSGPPSQKLCFFCNLFSAGAKTPKQALRLQIFPKICISGINSVSILHVFPDALVFWKCVSLPRKINVFWFCMHRTCTEEAPKHKLIQKSFKICHKAASDRFHAIFWLQNGTF